MTYPVSEFDQDPDAYQRGELWKDAKGIPGGIHGHPRPDDPRFTYRHSHKGWDVPHTHPRNVKEN